MASAKVSTSLQLRIFRYNEMLIITDTCQAESMGAEVYSPNVLTIGSSRVGEDSLAVSLHLFR